MEIKVKEGERIFLLSKHNGENQTWNEIKIEEYFKWISDGSIQDGDLIVISKKVIEAYEKKSVELKRQELAKKDDVILGVKEMEVKDGKN